MGSSWINTLENLQSKSDQLENIRGKHDSPYFIEDKTVLGSYLASIHFDFRKYFDLGDRSVSFFLMQDLFTGLLYYDTLILFLNPCKIDNFSKCNKFSMDELDNIISLSQDKRLIFGLTTSPINYIKYSYMQPIFENCIVDYFPWKPLRILSQELLNEIEEFDNITNSMVDLPSIKAAIYRKADMADESRERTEIGIIQTLDNLKYMNYHDLLNFILTLLLKEPDIAIDLIFASKRLLINPLEIAYNIPHCWSYEKLRYDFMTLGRNMKLRNLSLPGELGGLFNTNLSYPNPTNYDALRWCEENLDILAIRRSFSLIEKELMESLSDDYHVVDDIKDILNNMWEIHKNSISNIKKLVYWGSTLFVGAAGTLISGPITGLLASLGLTTLSNTLLGPFSEQAAKMFKRNSFHIWKLDSKMGRIHN